MTLPQAFNICSWGGGSPHSWGAGVAHSWRTGIDLFATFSVESERELGLPSFLQSVMRAVDSAERVAAFGEPGFAPDPDMLLVGVPGMTPYGVRHKKAAAPFLALTPLPPGIVDTCPPPVPDCVPGQYITRERWGRVGGLTPAEEASHLALWAILAAPLTLGNDPRRMSEATRALLTARGVLAVNQDALGLPGRRSWREVEGGNGGEVWARPLAGGATALLLLNRHNDAARDVAALWARDLDALSRPGPCGADKHRAWCPDWARSGECETNPGFMKAGCASSCPKLCEAAAAPLPLPAAARAMELTDAWTGEIVGVFVDGVEAKALPPHASRLLVVRPAAAGARRRSADAALTEPGAELHEVLGRATLAALAAAAALAALLFARVLLRMRRARRAR